MPTTTKESCRPTLSSRKCSTTPNQISPWATATSLDDSKYTVLLLTDMKTCIRDQQINVGSLVHFKMKFSTVRETLFIDIFMKKNFWQWALFSSVFKFNIQTYTFLHRFQKVHFSWKRPKWPHHPPPRLPVVVVVVAVGLVAIVAKHRLELPPRTSIVWQNPAPRKLSQLLASLGKEEGRAGSTGRQPHLKMQLIWTLSWG